MKTMLSCALAVCVLLPVHARVIGVDTQPPSPYHDTEASTNVAINAARSDVWAFEVRVDLECCESNCVQVAFGRDTDNDSDLAFEETDMLFGCRSGRCFIEDVAGDMRYIEGATTSEGNKFLHMRVVTDQEYVPKKVAFSTDEGACFADVAAECPTWLFRTDWNLLKVTRRGAASSSEVCRIDRISRSFHFIVR